MFFGEPSLLRNHLHTLFPPHTHTHTEDLWRGGRKRHSVPLHCRRDLRPRLAFQQACWFSRRLEGSTSGTTLWTRSSTHTQRGHSVRQRRVIILQRRLSLGMQGKLARRRHSLFKSSRRDAETNLPEEKHVLIIPSWTSLTV